MKQTSRHSIAARLLAFMLTLMVLNPGMILPARAAGPLSAGGTVTAIDADGMPQNYELENIPSDGVINASSSAGTAFLVSDAILGSTSRIVVAEGVKATLVLDGVNLTSSTSPLEIKAGAEVTLILVDGSENSFTCTGTSIRQDAVQAGIHVAMKAKLTILAQEGNTGKVTAKGGDFSAGIGAGPNQSCGAITIAGGIVHATSGKGTATGSGNGTGIGGGGGQSAGGGHSEGIRICGEAKVTAISMENGAGIGGGGGGKNLATDTNTSGGASGGNIMITGNASVTASSKGNGAGIGGGGASTHTNLPNAGAGGDITISGNASVAATSEGNGAGIGGGGSPGADAAGAGGDIAISGNAEVTASSANGAGIGGGGSPGTGTAGAGGNIRISGTPIIIAETENTSAVDMGPGISNGGGLGTEGSITITGGNVYAAKMDAVTVVNGFGDEIKMKSDTSVASNTLTTYQAINSDGDLYEYAAMGNAAGEAHVWLPPKNLTITVCSPDAPLVGAMVVVSKSGVPLSPLPLTDEGGNIELPSAYTGNYEITAAYPGYQTAGTTSNAKLVVIVLTRNTSGDSGGSGGLPDASLTIRCVDEDGAVLYEQSVSAVHGKTEIITAPPLRGYLLAAGEPGSQTRHITSGSNVVTFRYVVDEVSLENPRVPTGESGQRPAVSDAVRELLEAEEHIRYIQGYPDGTVQPESNISRAEVAVIFWRLTRASDKNSTVPNRFSDVEGGEWFAQAVNYLASTGILTGYEDGTFRPERSISRSEFAAMISRFDGLESATLNPFSDMHESHWAYSHVTSAYLKGWISGYPDRSFRPEASITRAEAIKIVNYMLGRGIQAKDIPEQLHNLYPDLSYHHWAFAEIIEASVEHGYERLDNGYEIYVDD